MTPTSSAAAAAVPAQHPAHPAHPATPAELAERAELAAWQRTSLGLVTATLLLGHAVAWLGQPGPLTSAVQSAGTAVGVAGLFFCAGWAGGLALASAEGGTAQRRRWALLALLAFAAYVLTGAAKAFLVDAMAPSLREVLRIATLRHVPSHSGFFLVIAAGAAAMAALPQWLRWATDSYQRLRWLAIPGFALAVFPIAGRLDPALGMLVGGQGHYLYPLLVWSPLLWSGVELGRRGPQGSGLLHPAHPAFIAGTTALCAVVLLFGAQPSPLKLGWLLAGLAGTLALVGLAHHLLRQPAGRALAAFGRQAGPVLVLGHVLIFAAVAAWGRPVAGG